MSDRAAHRATRPAWNNNAAEVNATESLKVHFISPLHCEDARSECPKLDMDQSQYVGAGASDRWYSTVYITAKALPGVHHKDSRGIRLAFIQFDQTRCICIVRCRCICICVDTRWYEIQQVTSEARRNGKVRSNGAACQPSVCSHGRCLRLRICRHGFAVRHALLR